MSAVKVKRYNSICLWEVPMSGYLPQNQCGRYFWYFLGLGIWRRMGWGWEHRAEWEPPQSPVQLLCFEPGKPKCLNSVSEAFSSSSPSTPLCSKRVRNPEGQPGNRDDTPTLMFLVSASNAHCPDLLAGPLWAHRRSPKTLGPRESQLWDRHPKLLPSSLPQTWFTQGCQF